VDQVTLLMQEIEDSFSAKKRQALCLSTLTAAYDSVTTAYNLMAA